MSDGDIPWKPLKLEKTWFTDMCPGGVFFSKKMAVFRVLTGNDGNRMGTRQNRQTWNYRKKPKKHEKTAKF